MGLFGALFAGVSGLDSQSNKIGIISNNISNVNTVGYKQGQATFDSLVVPSGTTTFSPGGVIGSNQQLVSQQGLISATTSATDAAISGSGFFIVNTKADGTGNVLFTRSGSFTQDSLGNFVNANGYFLQAYQLDANGNPPTNQNLTNLKTVNVNQAATGTATPTSLITIAANLDATHAVLAGSGVVAKLALDPANANNTQTQIIQPTTANGLVRGDSFSITNGANPIPDTFTYGGFTTGRQVGNGTLGDGGSAADKTAVAGDANQTYATNTVTTGITTNGTNLVNITVPTAAITSGQYTVGNNISISGITGSPGGVPAANINGEWKITAVNAGTGVVTFALASSSTPTAGTFDAGQNILFSNRTSTNFTGNILDASSPAGAFFNTTSSSGFSPDALSFRIAVNGSNFSFTYNAQPQASLGQFNSLNSLVNAINNSTNGSLTASVNASGQLVVSAADADSSLSFSNGNATGNASAGLAGVDWVQELGLPNAQLANINGGVTANPGAHYFNTLAGLAAKINSVDPTNVIATVNNPTGTATVTIDAADPQQTISFDDVTTNNGNSLINALGFLGVGNSGLTQQAAPDAGGKTIFTTGTLPIRYSAANPLTDMSSGAVPPQFTKDITIFDALGISHTLALNFAKLGTNTWAVELTAVPKTDVSSSDGQIAAGVVVFKGDGTLQQITGAGTNSITNPLQVTWTNGANQSNITVNLGTQGKSDGLIQSASAFDVSVANQNGSSVGQLTGVNIDTNGFVIESFSNGQTQKTYQVPLAQVNNPNGLEAVSGDAYKQTLASGVVNPQLPGSNGVGTISPSALEQSNVDLSTQLTDLIVAQQAYGANSKVLTVADQLLQQLDQIIQ